jgi:hypothetical protein
MSHPCLHKVWLLLLLACKGKGKKASGGTKYISDSDWKAMSTEAQTKVINACKKAAVDDDNEKSSASAKSAKMKKSISKTMKSLEMDNRRLQKSVSALQKCKGDDDSDLSISSTEGLSHFQKAIEFLQESYPKIALALKLSKSLDLDLRCVLLLDNQSTFDLCCNRDFMSRIRKASHSLNMTSNGGGLKITEQGKFPGYKIWVWFSKKAITNIICLNNPIKIYRVTYDSKVETTFVVHCQQFGLPDLFFEMHLCGLHICYPKKMGELGFIQMVKDNMKLFSKRQIAGANQGSNLFEKMIFPSTADFRAILSAGGVPGSDVMLEDVKAAEVIWGCSVLKMKGNTVRRNGKTVVQSIIKVLTELIKLHRDIKLAIDVFLLTNTSSSQPTAPRCASLRSHIWHTMRKNISGKPSW